MTDIENVNEEELNIENEDGIEGFDGNGDGDGIGDAEMNQEDIDLMLDNTHKDSIDMKTMLNKCLGQYGAYINYNRAIQDLTDGMKPAQRRIIYAMSQSGMTPGGKHLKSARLEGEVIGKYHPHGGCYSTFSAMAQDFTYRYTLIDGQGNFGSISGDKPAAQRYTEVRPSKLFNLLVEDMNKLPDEMFVDNYDGNLKEVKLLPAKVPFVLLNGTTGIGLGISSQTMSFNLGDVIDTLIGRLNDKEFAIETTLKGPDFCQKGLVETTSENWLNILKTGKGSVKFISDVEIKRSEKKTGNSEIIIKSLGPNIGVDKMIEKLKDLVEKKVIPEILDVRDESTSNIDLDLKIILKQKVNEDVVLNKLMKLTPLSMSVNTRMILLNEGKNPKIRNFYEIFDEFITWRKKIVLYILNYEKNRLVASESVIETKLKAISELDFIIKTIKEYDTDEDIISELMKKLKITQEGAELIMNLRVKQLKAFNKKDLEKDLEYTKSEIIRLTTIIENDDKLVKYLVDELTLIKKQYADKPRTKIKYTNGNSKVEASEDSFYEDWKIKVFLTKEGYLKKIDNFEASSQRRGGKGKSGDIKTLSEDKISKTLVTNNKNTIGLISESGKLFYVKGYQLPVNSKGMPIESIIGKDIGEKIINVFAYDDIIDGKIVVLYENGNGLITDGIHLNKRGGSNVFKGVVKYISGILEQDLKNSDSVYLLIGKNSGKGNKITLSQIPVLGKIGKGVKLISLSKDGIAKKIKNKKTKEVVIRMLEEKVISAEMVNINSKLLIISSLGLGKIINEENIKATNRGSKGVSIGIKGNDDLIYLGKVDAEDLEGIDIMLTTKNNKNVTISGSEFSKESKRSSLGIKLIKLEDEDEVIDVDIIG